MATSRPFAYNPGSLLSGTEQFGTIAVGTGDNPYDENYGELQWWQGPDEELGYCIGTSVPSGDQPTPLGDIGTVQFWRTNSLDENEFVELSNIVTGQNFTGATEAKTWLNGNGYWTSYEDNSGIVQDSLFVELNASTYTTGEWFDETGNDNNATINGATWLSTDGGIFDFDGVNDTISIPSVPELSLSTSIQKTIQVWVKFDTLPGSGQQVPVFGKLSSSFQFDGYWAGLFSNEGQVRCTTNGTAVQRISTSTLTVTTNTWYLFTFISQITSAANTTKVYINETEYITAAHGSDGYNESNPLYLGWIGSGIGSLYLDGKIGACYFYTKGLDVSEISQNFNATKSKYGL